MGAGAGVGAGICLELEPEPEILKMGGSVNPAMKLTVSACPEDWKYCISGLLARIMYSKYLVSRAAALAAIQYSRVKNEIVHHQTHQLSATQRICNMLFRD